MYIYSQTYNFLFCIFFLGHQGHYTAFALTTAWCGMFNDCLFKMSFTIGCINHDQIQHASRLYATKLYQYSNFNKKVK